MIRVLLHYYAGDGHEPQHVYLREARALRADLDVGHNRRIPDGRHASSEKLARIPHYQAGADERRRRRAERRATSRCWPRTSRRSRRCEEVVEAVARAAGGRQPLSGPGRPRRCASALAARYDFPAAGIAVGNGSCEILLAAAEALLEPWNEIVYAWPSFSMYPHLAAGDRREGGRGAARRTATCTTSTRWRPRSPTAPGCCSSATRTTRPAPTSRRARSPRSSSRCPADVLVILDEAYIEFQMVEDPDTSLDLVRRFPNLVDPAHLLEGLRPRGPAGRIRARLGGVPAAVDRVRQPFSVNQLAQAAATEALRHQDDVARRVEWNAVERLWMDGGAGASSASRSPTARPTSAGSPGRPRRGRGDARRWRAPGVAVRPGAALGGPGHLRVTYGTRAENERFIEALAARAIGADAAPPLKFALTYALPTCYKVPQMNEVTRASALIRRPPARRPRWRVLPFIAGDLARRSAGRRNALFCAGRAP